MKRYLLLLLIATSCAPTYIPNIRNSPMFTGKGETQINVQLGNGINGQAALAITDNFGIMGSYMYLERQSADPDSPQDYRRHSFGEAGIGYFKNTESMFFELFAGYGEGNGSSSDDYFFSTSNGIVTGNYKRYFVQPAFGLNKRAMFVSFVPRVSIVDFVEFSQGGARYKVNERPTVFWEPAVIGRANFDEHFYLTFQGGISAPIGRDMFFDHRFFQTSFGLGLRLGGKKLKDEND